MGLGKQIDINNDVNPKLVGFVVSSVIQQLNRQIDDHIWNQIFGGVGQPLEIQMTDEYR